MPKPRCQSGHAPNSSRPVRPRVCPPPSSASSPLPLLLVLDSLLSVLGVRKSILGVLQDWTRTLAQALVGLTRGADVSLLWPHLTQGLASVCCSPSGGGPRNAPSFSQAVHVVSGACTVAPKQTEPTGCSVGPALSARGCFSRKTL